jgi:hypothetical protein
MRCDVLLACKVTKIIGLEKRAPVPWRLRESFTNVVFVEFGSGIKHVVSFVDIAHGVNKIKVVVGHLIDVARQTSISIPAVVLDVLGHLINKRLGEPPWCSNIWYTFQQSHVKTKGAFHDIRDTLLGFGKK